MSRNPTHGQKVTDSNAPVIKEGAGAVASDSLAAESTRSGGGFASNRDSEPLGVKGSNSTFANTDTSSANRLDPAMDAETRMAESDWAEEKKLGAASSHYPQNSGGQSKSTATTGSYETGGKTSSAGTAPSYVSSQFVDERGPKGAGLKEGIEGKEGGNASFDGEIGGKNDPGRAALDKIVRENADRGEAAGMPKQKGNGGGNEYETLKGETPA